jgi:hypothetical protein
MQVQNAQIFILPVPEAVGGAENFTKPVIQNHHSCAALRVYDLDKRISWTASVLKTTSPRPAVSTQVSGNSVINKITQ